MAMLALFKKSQPLQPARDALRSHLATRSEIQLRRQKLAEKIALAKRDVRDADDAAAAAANLQGAIDQLSAEGRYTGVAVDVSQQERQLAQAKSRHGQLVAFGRSASIAASRYAADHDATASELATLNSLTPGLLHSALVESLGDYAEEFTRAEAALRSVHRRTFVAALAADRLALSEHLGEFCGSGGYFQLQITKPISYEPTYADDTERGKSYEAAIVSRRDDAAALEREADALINAMLSTEG
jgi:hypothetical protein